MTKSKTGIAIALLATLCAGNKADAEILVPMSDDGHITLSFTGSGGINFDSRPSYTTLGGADNAGFDRLRFTGNYRAQLGIGEIGDAFWSEMNLSARVTKIQPLDGTDSSLDIIIGDVDGLSFGGLNATFGTGNYYGFVSNGGVTVHGPGASHTGSFPRSAAGTGFFDTFQRIHGNNTHREDDILVATDASGVLNFISEDLGGTNEELFLGFGYVTEDANYAFQTSANGEWMSLSMGQKLTSELGMNAVLYKIDSTNRNGRLVDDWAYDLFLTHVTDRVEHGIRLTGFGQGPSPTWNADNRVRLRLSSSYAVTEKHAIGYNFDYEDFPVINATTGASTRVQDIRRLTVMYGYHLNEHFFLTARGTYTDTQVRSGALTGNKQHLMDWRLAVNYVF